MSDILPENGLNTYLVTKFLTYRIFQKWKTSVWESDIFYIFEMTTVIYFIFFVVHNGVETDFWLRHYFVWYIAWKWSHLYIFSDKISYLQIFSEETPVWQEWYILYFWDVQIDVHNGVETDFWLRYYFVWYIAWKWSHLYIFSDKISYLQIFSEKPLLARVIYFIFLRCPNWCPQWCRDRFLIKALFCLIYCLKMVSIHI